MSKKLYVGISEDNIFSSVENTGKSNIGVTYSYDTATGEYMLNGKTTSTGDLLLESGVVLDWTAGERYTVTITQTGGLAIMGDGTGITYSFSIFSMDNTKYMRNGNLSVAQFPGQLSYTASAIEESGGTGFKFYLQLWRPGTIFKDYKFKVEIRKEGIARKVKKIYIGKEGKARKVIKGYVGVKETYKVLDFIESTGTQYIDTLDTITAATKIELDFQLTSIPTTESAGIVGAYQWNDSSQTNDGMLLGVLESNFKFAYASGFAGSTISADLNRHTAIMNINNQCTLDGNKLIDTSNSNGTLPLDKSIYIFGTNGGTGTNRCAMKVYSYKKYEDNILVQDLIPIQTDTGIVCLYDKVTGKKFYNQGSGTFIAGNETGEPITTSTARVFFTNNKVLKSLGIVASKQNSLYGGGIASTQDYFIMAGGQTTEGGAPQSTAAEVYDLDFVRKTAGAISARRNVSGGSIGGYALFLGGYTRSSSSYSACSNVVEAYNNNLTKSTITSLTSQQHSPCVAFNDHHLMVFGAAQYDTSAKTVDSYNVNLVKTQCTDLASKRKSLAYTRCGNYLMAAGGSTSSNSVGGEVTTVEAYSNDLVKTTCSGIDAGVHNPSGGWVNGYAMIVGGSTSSESGACINTMNVYDENLTKRTSMKFPVAANEITRTTIANGKYAIFGSGRMGSGGSYTYPSTHYIYDEDLVLIKTIENSGMAGNVARWMATIGDIACRYNYGTGVGAIGLLEEE